MTSKKIERNDTSAVTADAISAQVFPGDGEMATLMRTMDWSRTPFGSVDGWSPSLRMMVRLLLANRFPLLLWWGPDFLQLYNDAYRPVLGTKHPQYLGRSVRECWREIIDVIGPLIETPFSGGPSTWMDDIFLEVNRYGFVEESHFTIAYSPVPDETAPNQIGGVLATVHEITEKVVGERRVVVLRDLGARASEAKNAEEACQIAVNTLAQHPQDIPFALLYLIDPDGMRAHLAAAAGVAMDTPLSPLSIELADIAGATAQTAWPLARATRREEIQMVEDLAERFERVPAGPWADAPNSAAVMCIPSNIAHRPAGLLVAGISARLRFDDAYAGFLELVSSQVATAIANARAYEDERRRAEALEEIDRAKTVFFSNVSHEFRTPLTLMLGPLEDLLSGNHLHPDARSRVQMVHRNGLRLLKLVNTLLDFSRIEAGRAQAVYAPTDLATLTADLASTFRSIVERAGLRLVVNCPPLSEPVYVNRDMWEKIVLNLLSNAFKFTFAGEIRVELRTAPPTPLLTGEESVAPPSRAGKGARGLGVVLTVSDTGTGIPPQEMPHLFERFHRVRDAASRTHEGSGIGLALVHDLVALHGGTIRAESEPGVGTTFVVSLPLGTAHLPADRIGANGTPAATALGAAPFVEEAQHWLPDDAPSAAAMDTPGWLRDDTLPAPRTLPEQRSARILLADDNGDMRTYLRRLLGERYTVEAVSNGARALAAARERPPDLVLSDVMMPELDGFALLRALRDDPRTRDIPVILLSARAGEEAIIEGLEAGADDYLIKPFSAREVLARVASHLEIARLRQDATEHSRQLEAIFEAAADGLVIYDSNGSMRQWNAATEALFELDQMPGYTRQPVGERPARLQVRDEHERPIPAERLAFMRAVRGEVLTGANAQDLSITTPSGKEKRVSASAAPLRDDAGRAIGAVTVYRDVTERRALEDAARETAERLRLALNASSSGTFIWYPTEDRGEPDAQMLRLFGLPPDATLNLAHALATMIHAEDHARYADAVARATDPAGSGELREDIRVLLPDGSERALAISAQVFFKGGPGEQRRAVRMAGTATDITDRKRLEQRTHEALEALLEMARAITAMPGALRTSAEMGAEGDESLDGPMPSGDADDEAAPTRRVVRRVVALIRRVMASGYTSVVVEDWATRTMTPLAVAGLPPAHAAHWWASMGGGRVEDFISPADAARLRAGEEMVFSNVSKQPPIPGQDYWGTQTNLVVPVPLDGRLILLTAEIRDRPTFTPQERDLARAAAHLSALVVERDRLVREQVRAEVRNLALTETNQRMSEFLSIASHELRTPLTSMSVHVQVAERELRALIAEDGHLLAGGVDGRIGRMLETLVRTDRQMKRLDRLIADLLDVSRIAAGKLEMRETRCDLRDIVREAVEEQQAAWPGRHISLDQPRRGPLAVEADADRIGQVVTNYLTNALKYSDGDQSVSVAVRVRAGRTRVTVRDHGPGLTPAQQEHLWEEFYRVPGIAARSGSGVGLGLGLYLCRTIVERHGGQVGLDTTPGDGSTFWFTLPLVGDADHQKSG